MLNRDIAGALRTLSDMQRPRSGAPRPPAPPGGPKSVRGVVAWAQQTADKLDREHEALRARHATGEHSWRRAKNGHQFRTTADLNAGAQRLLESVGHVRTHLWKHWQRYENGHAQRRADALASYQTGGPSPNRLDDERDALREAVELAADTLSDLRARIANSANQSKPDPLPEPARRDRWDVDEAAHAYWLFHQKHGRWPKKAEHTAANGLPDYKRLRELIGAQPIRAMVDFVSDDTN